MSKIIADVAKLKSQIARERARNAELRQEVRRLRVELVRQTKISEAYQIKKLQKAIQKM